MFSWPSIPTEVPQQPITRRRNRWREVYFASRVTHPRASPIPALSRSVTEAGTGGAAAFGRRGSLSRAIETAALAPGRGAALQSRRGTASPTTSSISPPMACPTTRVIRSSGSRRCTGAPSAEPVTGRPAGAGLPSTFRPSGSPAAAAGTPPRSAQASYEVPRMMGRIRQGRADGMRAGPARVAEP